jgi:hypothetical protein
MTRIGWREPHRGAAASPPERKNFVRKWFVFWCNLPGELYSLPGELYLPEHRKFAFRRL